MSPTPGPWQWAGAMLVASRVGTVVLRTHGHREVREADAALVAAAPELLEALEAALLRCEDCATCGPKACPACEAARATIRSTKRTL